MIILYRATHTGKTKLAQRLSKSTIILSVA